MSELPDEIDPATLARYLSGECGPAEAERIRSWIDADPKRQQLVEELRSAWTASESAGPRWNLDAMWTRISAEMDKPADRAPLGLVPSGTTETVPWHDRSIWRHRSWRPFAVAAGLAFVVGSTVLLVHRESTRAPDAVHPGPMREVATRRGQRAVFNLADGSRVMLGAESRLRIPHSYNTIAGGRQLFLEGEAYFEVRHDSTRSFQVHTRTGIAEDLGTEFVVTSYPETHGMRVVVRSGAVALRRAPRENGQAALVDTTPLLKLSGGDLGRLDTSGVAVLTRGADISSYLAWTKGTLLFDGTPLRDALPQIGRWYDLEIRLADSSIGDRHLTASFRDEAAPQMLKLLALSLDLTVAKSGRIVTLSPKSGSRHSS